MSIFCSIVASSFRDVHKKLQDNKNIETPWLGVPKSIAYEGGIRSWLTEARIEEVYNTAKEVTSLERSELVNRLCETNYKDNWMQIAFPDELARIEADYTKKEELLSDALEKLNDNKAAEIGVDFKTVLPECFNEDSMLKSLSELQDIYNNLPYKRAEEISRTARELSTTTTISESQLIGRDNNNKIEPNSPGPFELELIARGNEEKDQSRSAG